MVKTFEMGIEDILPSQLYISRQKLQKLQVSFHKDDLLDIDPIPIKQLNGKKIFVDGHTRAVALYLRGVKTITVYWEYEDLDWELYEICVQWCVDEKVFTIGDLNKRIIPHKQYEQLWYKRCDELHEHMKRQRTKQQQGTTPL